VHWVERLGLTNPRQLRRLHNSYNLLRKVEGQSDIMIDAEENALNPTPSYLWMLALMVLEFINGEEDGGKRKRYRIMIRSSERIDALNKNEPPELMNALYRIECYFERENKPPVVRRKVFESVERFVLPAIDGEGVDIPGEREQAVAEPNAGFVRPDR